MTADIGCNNQPPLRHCFQRLERRDEIGEPHPQPWINEHINQIVVSLYLVMGNASYEDNFVLHVQLRSKGL